MIFYSRDEDEGRVTITYRYLPYFYYVFFGFLVLAGLFRYPLSLVFLLISFVVSMVYAIDTVKPGREIRKAMEVDFVEFRGNRFSLSNPLIVRFKKK